jgi:tetratricopeptide (TPR) repeat protein
MSGLLHRLQRRKYSAQEYISPEAQIRQQYSQENASMEIDHATATPITHEEAAAGLNESLAQKDAGGFWQDESGPQNGPLEIPTKGLITRRGESQKVAQELMSQADEAFRRRDYLKAEKSYLQAATKDPDNARIYNRLGVIYLQMHNYKDAIEAFRGAIRFDDRIASRHYNLALAYIGKRDMRSAERCLREALRQEPTNEKYRKTLETVQHQPV